MSFSWSTGRYYWDFSNNGIADVSVVGVAGASVTQQTDGICLLQTASSDIKTTLNQQRSCSYNSTITAEVTCVAGTGSIGLCWRMQKYNTSDNSFTWFFGIYGNKWVLGTGSNSTYSNWSQKGTGNGTYTGRHTLKVVLNNKAITCYIDGVQVFSNTNMDYYVYYGYVCARAYLGDSTCRLHNLEILDNIIPNPVGRNMNRFICIAFDRPVHFPYADMSTYAGAFTAVFQQRDYYNGPLYQTSISAVDVKFAKDSNGNNINTKVLVEFTLDNNFRKAEGQITINFDNSKCLIYGPYIKDKLPAFSTLFTPTGLDEYQNPSSVDAIHTNVINDNIVVSTPVRTINVNLQTDNVNILITATNSIVPTLTGTIKP